MAPRDFLGETPLSSPSSHSAWVGPMDPSVFLTFESPRDETDKEGCPVWGAIGGLDTPIRFPPSRPHGVLAGLHGAPRSCGGQLESHPWELWPLCLRFRAGLSASCALALLCGPVPSLSGPQFPHFLQNLSAHRSQVKE